MIWTGVSDLFVKACWPPGGGDEFLEPCLLYSQRGLDVEEDHRPKHIKRETVKDQHPLNLQDKYI